MGEAVRVGVDVGGTFTDVLTVQNGTITVTKVPSTPDAPERAVRSGLTAMDTDRRAFDFLGHGTTVATNAVLEHDWAETALVTTAGFRDVLEIGRQDRPSLYDLEAEKPPPIVPRNRRHEVTERLDERGDVLESLSPSSIESITQTISEDVESVAISLLFAFENADHERRLAEALSSTHDVPVSHSSEVLPELREYERTLATTLNAALQPVMDRYLGRLTEALDELGIDCAPLLMGSNGGTMSVEAAQRRPVTTLLSGPAAGVKGAAFVAGHAGIDTLLTMDMGGTSCDVSLVRDGTPVVTSEGEVGDYPVSLPMVDVHTIGAGGGSIATVDAGGALRVGPESAGADPGPVCYGRGGTRPTVTDAHYLLGRIDPTRFGHGFEPDRDAVERAVETHVAEPLDRSIDAAARGILAVAAANMERALRVVSVERGHDPRNLTLVAFGGAGPLHAPRLADELDIPTVVIPPYAGALSALGLLTSDIRHDVSAGRVRVWDELEPATIDAAFEELEDQADDRLAEDGVPPGDRETSRAVDVRYRGQAYSLTVDAPVPIDTAALETLVERFHDRHESRYGHASPDEALELVALRVSARGPIEPPALDPPAADGSVDDAAREHRSVGFGESRRETSVYERARLPVGAAISGPGIVEGAESTLVVPPDHRVEVDDWGSLVLEGT